MTPWEIQGKEIANCNCNYGRPCQFNAPPTYGNCEAIVGYEITRGHFGDVNLDGLRVASAMSWPGPIHEGGGKAFIIIDERADEAQRSALLAILSGEHTEPGKTIWNVLAGTLDEVHDPAFEPIEIDIDVEARKGSVKVDGLIEMTGEPIRNPVTGDEHRARIDLPNGFEYSIAEMGSASGTAKGPIELEFKDSYGQFAHLHLNNNGVVR